ncbi:Importin-11 [Blattella germanica]|nr:Importin-11 [Blattella germanica]
MDITTAQSMVLETLQRAANQNAEILKPAELKLKEWETEPGFYSILLNIFSNHSIDVNVRWLAVLYFKNGVDRYWRKTAPNALSEAEKITLRQGLVSNFQEPINQIATQLAVLISKVARFDCPREWPELVPTLLTAVKSDDRLVQHRALLMLHHVIKALSSKRLAGDRRLFQELTTNVFSFVLNLWNSHVENFLAQMNTNSSEMGAALEKALLALRILRKLTVHGFKKPHESADAVHFLNMVFDRAKTMLECRKSLRSRGSNLLELSEKFIIHLTKVLIAVLEHHPFSYVELIQPSLEFAVFYVFTPSGEKTKEPGTLRAHEIKMTFFSSSTLTEMCRKLVTHYFLLTRDDLELWDTDPESFATDEGGESWKYSLRPCTESLFLALFHEFRVTLSPVLLEMIQNNHALVSPSDLNAILRKDAVYNAVGLAAFDLYDEVNFDQWFSTTLTQELKMKGDNYRVIRRRVVWLIGQWTGVKLSPELRPSLYAVTLPLLQGDEDMAVRLTASNTLKLAIDDFEFNTDQFLPFLEPSFSLLFSLLKEAHECDTKMHVLYVLSFIVERVGFAIRPYSGSLVQYLPLLWEESAEHNMLRCAIVSTLVHLVKVSTDVQQACHVYLLEDGLELWLAVLENSSSMSPDLLQLFQNMPPLLEFTSENLRTCFYIIQANILLSPDEFLKVYGTMIICSCNDMLSDMRSDGIVMTMRLVEMCLRAAPNVATELVKPMLPRIFQDIYRGEEYPMVMSMYLSIMGRILLCSRDVFSQVVAKVAQAIGETQEAVLNKMLDVWLDKMALVTQLERRKLLGLALASLLTAQSNSVLERFCGFLLNITEALNDIIKTDDMGMQIDSLLLTEHSSPGQDDDVDYETEHDHRRKQLAVSDPMKGLQNQVGASQFEQLMQTVDIETLEQVREYVVL